METLEKTLSHVESLSGSEGLQAVITIKEDGSYWTGDMYNMGGGASEYVNDPGIYEPDTKKQESARQQLQQVYDSSEWYSARYIAGRAIQIPKEKIHKNIGDWFELLRNDIVINDIEHSLVQDQSSIIVLEPEIGHEESYDTGSFDEGVWWGNEFVQHPIIGTRWVVDKPAITKPNIEKQEAAKRQLQPIYEAREKAKKDLSKLFDLTKSELDGKDRRDIGKILRRDKLSILEDELIYIGNLEELELEEIYNNSKNEVLRTYAGQKLDYSPLGIWAHEHPIPAALSGIVAISAASGAGYMIYQYLSR